MVSSNKDRDWDPDEPGFIWNDAAGETVRVDNKTYVRIPGGEIQIGHVSGRIVAWIDGKQVVLRSPQGGPSALETLQEREEVSQSMIRLWHGKYTKALALLREVGAGQVVNEDLVESVGIQITKDLWSRIGAFVDAREIAKEP